MRTTLLTLLHDAAMLVLIVVLGSWRFTGVPWHEYLSLALAVAVFVHLLRQRAWIVANASRLGSLPDWRSRVNVLLNVLMFATLVAVTASGLFASKVVWPHPRMDTASFLRWHDIHGYAGNGLQWLVALHLAVNWTPLLKRARALRASPGSPPRTLRVFPEGTGRVVLLSIWILAAGATLTGFTMAAQRLVPDPGTIMIDRADGRGEQPATQAEIVGLRPGQEAAHLDAFPRVALSLLATAIAAAVGRVVLRLRL